VTSGIYEVQLRKNSKILKKKTRPSLYAAKKMDLHDFNDSTGQK
jgi:hypothetical protein